MEPGKYTKPSSASSNIRDAARPSLDFELPDGADFVSMPPLVSLDRMISGSRQLRRMFPRGIRSAEERWAEKTNEEFRL